MDFLFVLQSFRESAGGIFTAFFQKMTLFGELNTTLVLLAIIYWCIDKKTGKFLMTGWCWNRLLNGFLKITACVYRPWILDSRIVPDQTALATATGYSFPSGHCVNSGSVFGGIALKKDTKTSLRVLCLISLLLVAFSRLYLCVHTPADVIVGAVCALLIMWFCRIVLQKTESKQNADIVIAAISIVISIAIAFYAQFKSYPVDYDKEGKILVEGIKMASDCFKGVGWSLGYFVGAVLEKRYVNFSSDGTVQQRAIRLVGGLLGFYFVNLILCSIIKLFITGTLATIVTNFFVMLYITLIFPYFIKTGQAASGVGDQNRSGILPG